MSIKTIISGATSPEMSRPFIKSQGGPPGTVLMRNDAPPGDLTAGDSATIQVSHDGGVNYVDMIKEGVVLALTDQNNHESVYGPGHYRLNLTNVAGPLSAYFIRG